MKTNISPVKKKRIIIENLWGFGMIGASVICILIFILYPLVFSFIISFQKWNPIRGGSFRGLSNYITVLKDNLFHTAMLNNFGYAFWTILGGFIFSFGAAVIVSTLPIRNILRFFYFIPTICSSIMIAMVWKYLLQPQIGLINTVLRMIGISSPPNWTASALTAPIALYIIVVWVGLGYWMIVFLTNLLDIPETYYEAATIDGASVWTQFIRITIPLSSPIIFFYLTMALITCWGQFDIALMLADYAGPGPSNSLLFPTYLMYRTAFNSMDFGVAAAMGWMLALFIFVIAFINNRLSKYWVTYDR